MDTVQGEFIVRDYAPSDYQGMIRLWESLGLGNSQRGDTAEVVQNSLEHGGRLLILEHHPSHSIIGTSWITVDGRRSYLHHFGIAVDFQGRKLANLLLKQTLIVIKEIGLQVKLEVHKSNHKAVNLYLRNGFKRLGDYDVYIIRDLNTLNEGSD